MTPDEVAAIRTERAKWYDCDHCAVECETCGDSPAVHVLALCDALEAAWAEGDNQ